MSCCIFKFFIGISIHIITRQFLELFINFPNSHLFFIYIYS
nr:MAG TPA: hypothetical protein [Caudoviricetes sp.]